MSLRSLSGFSLLFSMKESPTFAGTYQQPPTHGLSLLEPTDLHSSVEVKKDRAATERATSQTKLFVHIEETAHDLVVREHVSF